MAEQQAPQAPQAPPAAKMNGPRSELTRLGGILLGLALVIGAANNQAVELTGQILPKLPPPGGLGLRALAGLIGAVLLTWGLWGVMWPAWENTRTWWRQRGLPRRPARSVGIPPDRNPLFRDREHELERLYERLIREGRVVLRGMGGVGKSQLAIEYLHRHSDDGGRSDYADGVFWLRGDSGTTLNGDFAALAWLPQLELEERHQREQGRVIDAVAGWLHAHHRWLLVIDNLDEAAVPMLSSLVGRGLKGHVLVTSRLPIWDSAPLVVEPMPTDEAIAFLLERSGQSDETPARAVAEMLGGLPLALVQAAGYMAATGRDLPSYAELLRRRLGELMREGKPADYPNSVAATWLMSFQRIEHENPAAASLLRLCAFMNSHDIPLTLLQDGAGQLPADVREVAGDDIALDSAIGVLRRYAMLDRQGDRLRVHRLVQSVVRESIAADQRQRWQSAVIRLLEAVFPVHVDDPVNWPMCALLYPHVLAVLGDQVKDRVNLRLWPDHAGELDLPERIIKSGALRDGPASGPISSLLERIERYVLAVVHDEVSQILETLTARERRVLQLRFGLIDGRQLSEEDVGRHFGLTGVQIHQIQATALEKLRHPKRSNYLRDTLARLDPEALS